MPRQYPRHYFRTREGYCRHGVYVGGCGADYICGRCEDGDDARPHAWRDEYRAYTSNRASVTINGTHAYTATGARDINNYRRVIHLLTTKHADTTTATIRRYAYTPTGWVTMQPATPEPMPAELREQLADRARTRRADRQRRKDERTNPQIWDTATRAYYPDPRSRRQRRKEAHADTTNPFAEPRAE